MFTAFVIQATGSRLAMVIQSLGSIGFGIVIGFVYSWKLTLVLLGFAPFMLIAGFIKMRIMAGTRGELNRKMEEAAKVMMHYYYYYYLSLTIYSIPQGCRG